MESEVHLLALLVLSFFAAIAGVAVKHQAIRANFNRILGPALGLRASFFRADRDLALITFAARVENELVALANQVATRHWQDSNSGQPPGSRPGDLINDSDVTREYRALPTIDPVLGLRQESHYGYEYVSFAKQYRITMPCDSATLDDPRADIYVPLSVNGHKSVLRVANLLQESFYRLPLKTGGRQRNSYRTR